MTFEELKAEAKAQGYKLVKDNPAPKKLPCKCGNKRIEEWLSPDGYFYACTKCELQGKASKNRRKAIENWNKVVMEEDAY